MCWFLVRGTHTGELYRGGRGRRRVQQRGDSCRSPPGVSFSGKGAQRAYLTIAASTRGVTPARHGREVVFLLPVGRVVGMLYGSGPLGFGSQARLAL